MPAPAPAPARAALTFRGWGGLFLRRSGPAVRAPGSRALAWPSPPPPALCRDWTGPPGAGAAGANGPGGSFPAYGRPLGALRAGLRAAEVGRGAAAGEGPGGRGTWRRARAPPSSGAAGPTVLPPAGLGAGGSHGAGPRRQGCRVGAGPRARPGAAAVPRIPATRRGTPRLPLEGWLGEPPWGTVRERREDKGNRYLCCVLVCKLVRERRSSALRD